MLKTSTPLVPDVPALAVSNRSAPLEPDEEYPLITDTSPPVPLEVAPAAITTAPPTPLSPLPTVK